jgi:hypothetical protein
MTFSPEDMQMKVLKKQKPQQKGAKNNPLKIHITNFSNKSS